ncbi:MAG: ferrochelatase [Armatimonadetes bacterium]|nr:ferrochelatase [Armatimonadota bacterium]
MSESPKNGLLVMHYGTPASIEAIEPYYTHIRRGRAPSREQLKKLTGRYIAIGGPSPLTRISQAQAELINVGLREAGVEAKAYIGTKHSSPFVADAVKQMADDGVEEAVGVVLAPHYSGMSIRAYEKYANDARSEHAPNMKLNVVQRWGTMPELIAALADRVEQQTKGWSPEETIVLFTAHSLPQSIVADGDPYQDELEETSRLVAEEGSVPNWSFCFQSASATGARWLGPDVLDVMQDVRDEGRFSKVIACTVGFVSDHLEVLYDLGIEAQEKADELGLEYRRAEAINEDATVMAALGRLVAAQFSAQVLAGGI